MLPKIDVPIYTINLLSTGKPTRFRPFTVKEEKLFLMTAQSEDLKEIFNTTKQVINNCVLDDIDIEELPMFDIEHLFLNIRARSISEVVNLKYKCNNVVKTEEGEEKVCNNLVDLEINVLEIEPTKDKNHNKKIEITNNVGFVMKYPTLKLFEKVDINTDVESILEMTINCIDFVYDGDNVYYSKDVSKEELTEFIENLQTKELEKIKEFFLTMPKLQKNVHFRCNKCKYEEDISVEGIESFFV
jgi:hypothetical protein